MKTHPPVRTTDRLAAITALLACPSCGGALLSASDTSLRCAGCHRGYPVRAGVPILLPESMPEPGVGTVSADDPVSRHPYSPAALEIIAKHHDGWVLDLGAGGKFQRWDNVIQVDIFRYPMTDVVATADRLPFRDNAFKAVISQAVFEHLQYPEWAAAEIRRVLQPGGVAKIDTAFLQPEHGYPHHFYNATETGLRHWFRDFEIRWSGVEAYQHPKWSLSWFLGVYLDRIGSIHGQVLSSASIAQVMQALQRSSVGQAQAPDLPLLAAFDALPLHEVRTLAAGVSIEAVNPSKTTEALVRRESPTIAPGNVDDQRKLVAAREDIKYLNEELDTARELRLIALDRGNYLAQFHPDFDSLQHLGLRAWMQFRLASVLRMVLPPRYWFRVRNMLKGNDVATRGDGTPLDAPFLSVILDPQDPTALINTFFSLVRQTHSAWELVLIERPGQLPGVRRAWRDFSRLDQRVRILRVTGGQRSRLEQARSVARGDYLINLPEGGTLALDAIRSMVTMVQSRPETSSIVADFEHTLDDTIQPMRCYNQPRSDAACGELIDVFSFTVHGLRGAMSGSVKGAPASPESSVAYIPKVLFRHAGKAKFITCQSQGV